VLIGTAKTPRNTNKALWDNLGIKYYSNNSAWMTSEMFIDFLLQFDNRCEKTTVLLLDNFSGHTKDVQELDFRYLVLIFLPNNSTSKTQPLDAGIIANFKLNYRSKLLEYVCARIIEDETYEAKVLSSRVTQDPPRPIILKKASPSFTMNEINYPKFIPSFR
jgi:hypothetical protein